MNTKVHSIHFNADKKLLDFVEDRIDKLGLFYDGIVTSEVFLRLDKASDTENKIAEVKMRIPGKDLFAKKKCKSFEEATDSAVEALLRQLKKHKGKQKNKHSSKKNDTPVFD